MSQIFEYSRSRLTSNVITIGTDGNWFLCQIPFPAAAYLTKILAQQVVGSPVAFKVDILTSGLGLSPYGEIVPGTLPAGWQMRRVISPQSSGAGSQIAYFPVYGNPYRNQDGADPVRTGVSQAALQAGQTSYTNAQRYLYALLQPAGGQGANSTWELALGAWTDIGG